MLRLPLSNERLHLRSPSINVCFRTIIEGKPDKTGIENALKKVVIKHPLLTSSIEIDQDNNAWCIQSDRPIGIDHYRSDEMDWQTWYKKTDHQPFDLLNGPLVKFCVITGQNTEIIVVGHHIIGDGIGYLNLVKDLLLTLDNRLDTTPQIPPFEPTDRYFKETILLDPMTKSYAIGLNQEWRKSRVRFSEEDYQTFYKQYRDKYKPDLTMATIEGDNLQRLMEKSKSNGMTVNELIASAFSAATMEQLGVKEIRLGVAANIRNELVSEPNACMGNYVSGISVTVHHDPDNGFISNARSMAALLKSQLTNPQNRHLVVHFLNEFDNDLIESIPLAAYGNLDHPISKKLAELIGEQAVNKGLGISNLGRHRLRDYENLKVMDVQFIGPAFPANLLTVGVITVNNKLNLCLRYNAGEIKADAISKIYSQAIGLLTQ
ncbi:MAG: hypothetical protein KBA26_08585 [Candidatus Delongbacteria bacterium]|nr:hypothetical protein [Candidatus Delongbacteria bacterium]